MASASNHTHWNDTSQSNPWYIVEPPVFTSMARKVFSQYCKLPEADWVSHVTNIRDRAWLDSPFPCVGCWFFINFEIVWQHPEYDEVVERLRKGQSIIDIGCGIGQDLRAPVCDGVPVSSITAVDMKQELWDLGFDLFLDRGTFNARFIRLDVVQQIDELLDMDTRYDFVHVADLLHLFPMSHQLPLASKLLKLLKRSAGSVLLGRNVGTRLAARWQVSPHGESFRSSVDTTRRLWEQALAEAGLTGEISCKLGEYVLRNKVADQDFTVGGTDPVVRVVFSVRLL